MNVERPATTTKRRALSRFYCLSRNTERVASNASNRNWICRLKGSSTEQDSRENARTERPNSYFFQKFSTKYAKAIPPQQLQRSWNDAGTCGEGQRQNLCRRGSTSR